MPAMTYYSAHFRFGTSAADSLTGGSDQNVLGLDGNDVLSSTGWGVTALLGGAGDDTYIADAAMTQIADGAGRDTLYIPGWAEDYEGAFISDRHLLLYNAWSDQTVLVLDFKGSGRIEHFVDEAGARMSAQHVEASVYSDGYGNIAFSDIQALLGSESPDQAAFDGLVEVDMVFARLNWSNVFQHLAEAGRHDAGALADAIQYEAMPLLGAKAQQLWHEGGMYTALAGSTFEGVEASLPLLPSPSIPQTLVEDMALLYQAALDRQPDQDGLNYFVSNLKDGQSLQDIANSFYLADEFRAQFQQFDNESYINQLYGNVLERSADPAGLDYWLVDMEQNGRSHADVLVSFAQSAENYTNAAGWLSGLEYVGAADLWLI